MKKWILVLACLAFAGAAVAAEKEHDCAMMMSQSQQQMDAKLQQLVDTMNKATGQAKVDAMAAVINELVSQRVAMKTEMQHMQHHGEGHDCPMMKEKPASKGE